MAPATSVKNIPLVVTYICLSYTYVAHLYFSQICHCGFPMLALQAFMYLPVIGGVPDIVNRFMH